MASVVIAIDGPSGAGKGTVARRVADRLGYRHVDTGAMYRAVAWAAVERGIALDDEAAVAAVADGARIEVDATRVAIDGVDITAVIRTPVVDRAASLVARLPDVRAILVAQQRAMAGDGNLVMEGRDIGTVVFPEAPVEDLPGCGSRRARPAPRPRSGAPVGQLQRRRRRDRARRSRCQRSQPGHLAAVDGRRRGAPRHHAHDDCRGGRPRPGARRRAPAAGLRPAAATAPAAVR